MMMRGVGRGWAISLLLCGYGAVAWEPSNLKGRGMVKTPVVDLFLKPAIQGDPPLSPVGPAGFSQCHRSHQALAHDVVEIQARDGELVRIGYDALVYGFDAASGKALSHFWIHEKHLIPLEVLSPQALEAVPCLDAIPRTTVVLTLPWEQYSFGTHFVRAAVHDTESVFGAYRLNEQLGMAELIFIPRDRARVFNSEDDPQKIRESIVATVKRLIVHAAEKTQDGVVPYVLGGGSFVRASRDGDQVIDGEVWRRPQPSDLRLDGSIEEAVPHSGFDCSELIFRLARMHGIDYQAKTTAVIKDCARELQPDEPLEQGDLLWFKGHVMLVGDIHQAEIIEARGYGSGYGRVHVLPLERCFEGVASYQQLRKKYAENAPLTLINRDGTLGSTVTEWKLYSLIRKDVREAACAAICTR